MGFSPAAPQLHATLVALAMPILVLSKETVVPRTRLTIRGIALAEKGSARGGGQASAPGKP